MFAWEIRDRLLQDRVCDSETVPSVSSINRYTGQDRTCSGHHAQHSKLIFLYTGGTRLVTDMAIFSIQYFECKSEIFEKLGGPPQSGTCLLTFRCLTKICRFQLISTFV